MTVLSAALAFAITMLILSMVTSVFVETIHRFIGLRERGLRLMVGHVFDRVIAPYVEKEGVDPVALKTEFQELMTVNRAPAGVAPVKRGADKPDLTSDAVKEDSGLLSRIWRGRRLTRLNAGQFMSRLGGSDFGDLVRQAIQSSGIAEPEAALKDIADKFDQFGREASVFFERRARLAAVLSAMAVSWLMYVHPYELFKTYMNEPEVAQAVIEMQDDVLATYKAQVAAASTVAAEAAAKAAEADKVDAADADAKQAELDAAIAKRDQAIAAMDEATKSLQAVGVPIGWTEQRLNASGFARDPWFGIPWPQFKSGNLHTVVWLLVGGLLVGLGAPFWHDMVKSLSSIRTMIGGPKSMSNTGPAEATVPGSAEEQPQTPVAHFLVSAAGRDAAVKIETDDDEAVG
jgi:hypothetical protein